MEIILTEDGSHTIFNERFNEIYHSRRGALGESQHVYIRNGFKYFNQPQLSIFEVGFGTGLNAFLTLCEAEQYGVKVDYTSIELYPVDLDLITKLNFTELLKGNKYNDYFNTLHEVDWKTTHQISSNFTLQKVQESLFDYQLPANHFDLIYFDAFGPATQPEMWQAPLLQKMYDTLTPGGILVTYCSKSVFRRALEQVGFTVQKPSGPWGKREMVRAIKPI
jgi:tRNA U34 5-methylaminomethyl-2-thiouridine-forming methyltransferase MnmC